MKPFSAFSSAQCECHCNPQLEVVRQSKETLSLVQPLSDGDGYQPFSSKKLTDHCLLATADINILLRILFSCGLVFSNLI